MKIFMMNLKRSPERKVYMEHQLQDLGLDFEYIEAVDGSKLTEAEIDQLCDRNAIAQHPDWLKPGALGCSLSHYYIYKNIVENNIPYALILEDDVELDDNLPQMIQAIEEKALSVLDDELIFLFLASPNVMYFSKMEGIPLNEKNQVRSGLDIRAFCCSGAYFISHQVAKRMMNCILPVRVSADTWHYFRDEGCYKNVRCIIPFAAKPAMFESTIGYVSKGSFLFQLKEWIKTKPVLNHIYKIRRRLYWRRWSRIALK